MLLFCETGNAAIIEDIATTMLSARRVMLLAMQYNNFDVRSRGRLKIPTDRWKQLRELEKKVLESRQTLKREARVQQPS